MYSVSEYLPYERYGWQWSNELQRVVPVWLVGHQLPEDLRSKKTKTVAPVDEMDADNECDDEGCIRNTCHQLNFCVLSNGMLRYAKF